MNFVNEALKKISEGYFVFYSGDGVWYFVQIYFLIISVYKFIYLFIF